MTCPNCGAEVPPNAKACPECGSDEQTGWSEEARTAGADLPDDDFDYERFVQEEFGSDPRPKGLSWFWWIVAILLMLGLLSLWMF